MPTYVCVHGHYYQPSREEPFTERVPVHRTAAPFRDWNTRIARECYLPNTAAHIHDAQGHVARVTNNFGWMSYDLGPTLLRWLQVHAPETYASMLEGERASRENFGVSSALAQPFHHAILPLCNERDRRTEIAWGIADYKRRFGTLPAGMWAPETAVDLATLQAMVDAGIRYTLLAPGQAKAIRAPDARVWQEVEASTLPSWRPYRLALPSGDVMTVVFYAGSISHDVAFDDLLSSGDTFAARLEGYEGEGEHPLVTVATDGESYGHHHRFGEMALAAALERVRDSSELELTNLGRYLEQFPPTWEAQLHERSSWSCVHGVERWRSDCGCRMSSGSQAWRAPLREALEWLRDELAAVFEGHGESVFIDPWAARDAFGDVAADPQPAAYEAWFTDHVQRSDERTQRERAAHLIEMQRHALMMFTSCGWFFDDVAGLEPVQNLRFAAYAIRLARWLGAADFEPALLDRLRKAPCNHDNFADAAEVYVRRVRPAVSDGRHVAAEAVLLHELGSAMDGAMVDSTISTADPNSASDHLRVTLRHQRLLTEETWLGTLQPPDAVTLEVEQSSFPTGTGQEPANLTLAHIYPPGSFNAAASEHLRSHLPDTERSLALMRLLASGQDGSELWLGLLAEQAFPSLVDAADDVGMEQLLGAIVGSGTRLSGRVGAQLTEQLCRCAAESPLDVLVKQLQLGLRLAQALELTIDRWMIQNTWVRRSRSVGATTDPTIDSLLGVSSSCVLDR